MTFKRSATKTSVYARLITPDYISLEIIQFASELFFHTTSSLRVIHSCRLKWPPCIIKYATSIMYFCNENVYLIYFAKSVQTSGQKSPPSIKPLILYVTLVTCVRNMGP